jgi:type II secretory pathway component PulF
MPEYSYTAKNGPTKTVSGRIVASSRDDAVAKVDALGYSPLSVTETAGEGSRRHIRRGRVRRADITLFTRQLASLVRSGVPILRALRTIADQTDSPAMSSMVFDMQAGVRDGRPLSEMMSGRPSDFSVLYVNMVRAGESGGVLDVVLERLAETREREDEVTRRVQAALAYPALVLAVGAVTVFVLLSFFLPRMASIFQGYGRLPAPTRVLMAVSNSFSAFWPWVVGAAALLLAAVARLTASARGRMFLDRTWLATPLVGSIARDSEIARFARTLALLLESGISIDNALRLCEGVVRNTVLRSGVTQARERTVSHGSSFSAGLRSSGMFPPFVSNMAAVGEEGGTLDKALEEVASFYERSVEQRTRLATSLLEPVLILVVGGVVGFIVAAMLLPIFEVGTVLR